MLQKQTPKDSLDRERIAFMLRSLVDEYSWWDAKYVSKEMSNEDHKNLLTALYESSESVSIRNNFPYKETAFTLLTNSTMVSLDQFNRHQDKMECTIKVVYREKVETTFFVGMPLSYIFEVYYTNAYDDEVNSLSSVLWSGDETCLRPIPYMDEFADLKIDEPKEEEKKEELEKKEPEKEETSKDEEGPRWSSAEDILDKLIELFNIKEEIQTMKDLEKIVEERDSYIKSLKKKVDNKEKLTNEEKDFLFEAIGLGESTFAYLTTEKKSIDFSSCLSRYLWFGEDNDTITFLSAGYAPDKDTVARYFTDYDYFNIIKVCEEMPTMYKNGERLKL